MYELRQPPTSFGVANESSDDKVITNENRQENADYHMMTGGLGIADYHIYPILKYFFRLFSTKNLILSFFAYVNGKYLGRDFCC